MPPTRRSWDIVILGGGPAGTSAALQLAAREPHRIEHTLLVDAAVFPRPKLCGGGLVRQADRYLAYLGVRLDVPSQPIHTLCFEHGGGRSVHRQQHAFRVVRREELDHALLQEVRRRGIRVHEGERVLHLRRAEDGILVTTARGEYQTKVLIGADGANGRTRRDLVGGPERRRFVALEAFTPRLAKESVDPAVHTAVFDFRGAVDGLRGYYWDFPSLHEGRPRMNRGIGASDWRDGGALRQRFAAELARRGQAGAAGAARGATIPLYDPRLPQSAAHVVLAGDAVGVDPWLGEGISVAIGTGMLAAHAAVDALASGDLSFAHYTHKIADSPLGRHLRRNRALARRFYRAAANVPPQSPRLV